MRILMGKMRRSTLVAVAVGITLVGTSPTEGQQTTSMDQFVGTWKLLNFFSRNVDTGGTVNRLGDHPRGYLVLTADGWIALTFVDSSRKAHGGATPTDAEAAELWRTMSGYVSRYHGDPAPTEAGYKVTVRSEVSAAPTQEGIDRGFFLKTEGT